MDLSSLHRDHGVNVGEDLPSRASWLFEVCQLTFAVRHEHVYFFFSEKPWQSDTTQDRSSFSCAKLERNAI